MNLLRVTQKAKLYDIFLKHPEIVFSPKTAGLTCKINTQSARRLFIVLFKENKIMRVQRGFYKLNL